MELTKQTTPNIYFSCEPTDRAQLGLLTENLALSGLNPRFEADPDPLGNRAYVLVIGAQGISQRQQAELKQAQKWASRDQKYHLFAGNRVFRLVVILLPTAPDNLELKSLALNYSLLDFRQGLPQNAAEKLLQALNAPPPTLELAIEPVSEIILQLEPDEAETQLEEAPPPLSTPKFQAKIVRPELKLLFYDGIGLAALLIILMLGEARNLRQQNQLITNQKLAAEEQQRIFQSREIAVNANLIAKTDPQLSLLLAIEAAKTAPTAEAEQVLRQAVTRLIPRQLQFGIPNEVFSRIVSSAFSQDGRFIALSLMPKDTSKQWGLQVWEVLTEQKVAELTDNTSEVYNLVFSPNNKLLLTGGNSAKGQVWDIASQQVLFEIPNSGYGVAFSPNNKLVATGGFPQTSIKILDTSNGSQIAEITNIKVDDFRPIQGITFSPDSKLLAYNNEQAAQVFDIATGETLRGFSNGFLSRGGLVFSPDGKLLADIDDKKSVRLWEVATGKLEREITVYANNAEISRLVFSPDGQTIAISGFNDFTNTINTSTGRYNAYIAGEYVEWSPDGRYILTKNNQTRVLNLVDVSDGQVLMEMTPSSGVISARFLAGGKTVVSVSSEYSSRWNTQLVQRWDVSQKTARATILGTDSPIKSLTFSPNGRLLATIGFGKTAQVLDGFSGQMLVTLNGHTEDVLKVIFSPDAKLLATVSRDGTARLWEAESGRTKAILRGHTKPINDAAFSPDGKYLVTASDDSTARIWEVESGRTIVTLPTKVALSEIVFSPDGKHFITDGSNVPQLWEAGTGKLVADLTWKNSLIKTIAFSPDSKYFFLGSYSLSGQVGETATGRKLVDLAGDFGDLKGAIFSPDSQKITTVEGDQGSGWQIRAWETSTGKEIGHYPPNNNGSFGVSVFSPDGKFGAVLTESSVYVWEVSTGLTTTQITVGDVNFFQSNLAFSPDNKILAVGSSHGEVRMFALPECGPVADLLALASYKSYRELTASERAQYLHQTAPEIGKDEG